MLYVKVDKDRKPLERAKNYREISEEFKARGQTIPPENLFLALCTDEIDITGSVVKSTFEYASVPEDVSAVPPNEIGKKSIPDVPILREDGSFQRTWRLVEVTAEEKESVAKLMRERRTRLLQENIDSISPVRWELMNEQEKHEVSEWRQKLLDMTNDAMWPFMTFPPIPQFCKNL